MAATRLVLTALLLAGLLAGGARADEETGFIGVQIRADEGGMGIQVQGLIGDDCPAAKGGVKVDDLITKLNKEAVSDLQEFVKKIRETKPGTEITLTVLRDGKDVDLKFKVGKKPAE
jgi:S1-C subfamily serine protease